MYKDRGMLKWAPAAFIPQQMDKLKKAQRDAEKVPKPILDEHQIEEFENTILNAMEFNFTIKVKVWNDGFIEEKLIKVFYLNEYKKQIHAFVDEVNTCVIDYEDVVGIEIHDNRYIK